MRFFKLALATGLCILVSWPRNLPDPPDAAARAASLPRQYSEAEAMLQGELTRLKSAIDPESGTAIYTSFELGYPLVRAIFARGNPALKRELVADMAAVVSNLPTYGSLVDRYGDGPLARAVDAVSPKVQRLRLAVDASVGRFDGLPLPEDRRLRGYRVFPLKSGDQLQINTGNIHQFGYLLSTVVRLGSQDPAIVSDPRARGDLQVIARYLSHDFVRFFWVDAPAWHWSGPYLGGMRERTLDRLANGPKMQKRRFFRGFLDYDIHLMAVAADLRVAQRAEASLVPADDMAALNDVNRITAQVLRERVDTGPDGKGFAFDRGFWDDNPIAEYAGCKDKSVPRRACPLTGYTIDISHAQRWPAWLESFAAAASNARDRARIDQWRANLAHEIGDNLTYQEGRLLLPNFLDGRNGWLVLVGSVDGHGAYPPSSMTGWAMRYGMFARLAPLDPRIADAERRFCAVIESSDPPDIRFRMANYGEPEANPANGVRPQTDEYGPTSVYASICSMTELMGFG